MPNVGKSTLLNALLKRRIAKVGKYPFTTVEKNTGVAVVPDEHLKALSQMVVDGKRIDEIKVVPAAIKFVDIAGLVRGAHKGEGLGNEFLGYIREVSAICHVVRVFEDPNVPHIIGSIDPKRDIEVVNTELILKDLETIEKIENKKQRTKNKKFGDVVEKVGAGLNQGRMVRDLGLSEREKDQIKDLCFLTAKPVVYVFNVSEAQISSLSGGQEIEVSEDQSSQKAGAERRLVEKLINRLSHPSVTLSALLEEELFDLAPKEQKEYLGALGLKESGVERLIKICFDLLDLIVFYTIAKGRVVRAWPVKKGTTAFQGAGLIHSEIAHGFIKAEIIDCSLLQKIGSWEEAEKRGLVRLVGRDYVIKDREVVEFKFSV